MTTTGQTAGQAALAGGDKGWGKGCREALAACGIDPDNVGTYDDRLDAQSAVRQPYAARRQAEAVAATKRGKKAQQKALKPPGQKPRGHEACCPRSRPGQLEAKGIPCRCHESQTALKELGRKQWLLGNAESGHMSTNGRYQTHRGDPCSNLAPGRGNGGTYGYDDNKALCMDHTGRNTWSGTHNNHLTQDECAQRQALKAKGVERLDMKQLKAGVKTSAKHFSGNGGGWDRYSENPHNPNDPKLTPKQKKAELAKFRDRERQNKQDLKEALKTRKLFDEQRQQEAVELRQKEAQRAEDAKAKAAGRKAKKVKKPKKRPATKAEMDKAAQCQTDRWVKSLDEMRANAVAEHGPKASPRTLAIANENRRKWNKAHPNKKKPVPATWDDLSNAEKKHAVNQRQSELETMGAHNAGKAQTNASGKHPTKDDCREYQANWLWKNGQGKDGGPPYPEMRGKPDGVKLDPNGKPPAPTPPPAPRRPSNPPRRNGGRRGRP